MPSGVSAGGCPSAIVRSVRPRNVLYECRMWWLCSVLIVTLLPLCAHAAVYLVVDVDGAVEDYAALTTILRHSTARSQLSLVTVNGNSWGSLKTTEANIKRFLTLAGAMPPVIVAIGGSRTIRDSFNVTLSRGDCAESQGIPRTPNAAAQRGMKVSRFDVDRCFGAVTQLPRPSASVLATSYDATTVLLNVMGGLSSGEQIYYLALSSLTNFAAFLSKATTSGLLPQVVSSVQLFTYENGNNWAMDPTATTNVFQQTGLSITCLTPQLWKSSVVFSKYYWSLFVTTATMYSTTSAEVRWLYQAWNAKKFHFDGSSTTAVSFFLERGPASSLVTLCVVDTYVRSICSKYMSSTTTIALSYSNRTLTATRSSPDAFGSWTASIKYDYVTGNNVTRPCFLQYPATTLITNGSSIVTQVVLAGANAVVADFPADYAWPGSTRLIDAFWTTWTSILSH